MPVTKETVAKFLERMEERTRTFKRSDTPWGFVPLLRDDVMRLIRLASRRAPKRKEKSDDGNR